MRASGQYCFYKKMDFDGYPAMGLPIPLASSVTVRQKLQSNRTKSQNWKNIPTEKENGSMI